MKILKNWRRRLQVQNTLHWQSMRNLTYILGFWLHLLLMCSPFFFLFPDVHHPICAYDFCSLISLCFTSFAICRITWTSMWTERIPTYGLLHFYYCTLIYLESICMAVFTLFFDKASNILIL